MASVHPPQSLRQSSSRAVLADVSDFSTVVLVDINGRAILNLHRVPQHVTVMDVKNKISERLKDVGRILPADLMILKFGENAETEMENAQPLNFYNKMGLSRIQVQISKRHKFDINIVVIKPEAKCVCITTSKRQELSFPVCVPSNCYVKQLRMEIARRMNCDVDRHDVELFSDPQLQEHIVIEGTCRARGINHESTVYTRFPPNFDINNLAPLEVPRQTDAGKEKKAQGEQEEGAKTTEDILTDSTEAAEEKAAPKTALQLDFEKRAGKALFMSSDQAGKFARILGYSPSASDLATLPDQVDYKSFQVFLTSALHTEDLAESFQRFFSMFDVQATGDLSAKQLCNILQMYGDEPLTKAEAEKFTQLIMDGEDPLPIKVIVERVMEGQV